MKVQCRKVRQRILDYFNGTPQAPGPVAKAYAVWQDLTKKRAEALQQVEETERILIPKLLEWERAEQRRAQQAQLEEAAAARRKAEDERLEAAAELESAAVAAGDSDLLAAAEEMIEFPIEAAPVYVAPAVPKVDGLQRRKTLYVEVSDMRKLILATAAREMIDILAAAPVQGPHDAAIVLFLTAFKPPKQSPLDAAARMTDGKVVGVGPFDSNLAWIRAEKKNKGAAFSLPGVVAEEREQLV